MLVNVKVSPFPCPLESNVCLRMVIYLQFYYFSLSKPSSYFKNLGSAKRSQKYPVQHCLLPKKLVWTMIVKLNVTGNWCHSPTEDVSLFLLISFITPLLGSLLEFEMAKWFDLATALASFESLKCRLGMVQTLLNECKPNYYSALQLAVRVALDFQRNLALSRHS